ncbi:MAG TPA: S24/S26 family peptidase, partial [Mycobacteriales bacterium]|nr:S24/S26 family peptidase [Mycobacteriales bacterium]
MDSREVRVRAVLVHGPSMVPALRHGDAVLVRPGSARIRPGDVVVARFRTR